MRTFYAALITASGFFALAISPALAGQELQHLYFEKASNPQREAEQKKAHDLLPQLNARLSQGKLDEAKMLLKEKTAAQPKNYYLRLYQAYLDEQSYESENALALVNSILATEPNCFEALNIKSRCLMALDKTLEGLKVAQQAAKINPKNLGPLEVQANAFLALRKYKEAAETYGKLSVLEPNDTMYLHNQSMCLMKSGRLIEAEKVARIVEKRHLNPQYRASLRLAEVLYAEKKYPEAEVWAKKAIKEMPEQPNSHEVLIRILKAQNKTAAVIKEENFLKHLSKDLYFDKSFGEK